MIFPLLYMNTPLIEEKIKWQDKIYLVHSKIDVCIYKIDTENYCGVISKELIFTNGKKENVLLKYISKMKTYNDVIDLTDEFLKKIAK